MSPSVMRAGVRARREPPCAPDCEVTRRAARSAHRMRRITTGLVLTLAATRSDFSGSSPAPASNASTCTATAKRLLPLGIIYIPVCDGIRIRNYYSYKGELVKDGDRQVSTACGSGRVLVA